ncbi:MAG: DNA polymerase IV [Chloroflexota bacterium]|nr:DNA polymerase IV [Chloroflexota bacterium]
MNKQRASQESLTDTARAILHLDLDAFFAAVEILEDPLLEGKPVLVGGRPEQRGVVAAASYPARAHGCRSAMPMARALTLCPQAVVLPPRHNLYRTYSAKVMALIYEITPEVEQLSIDEAFLDISDQLQHWNEAIQVARQLQRQVQNDIGLSASLGVASNKQVAKVASDYEKPGGLTVVRPGDEPAFLAPLHVRALWGIGPVTTERLEAMGVTTVGELAIQPEAALQTAFGKHGPEMLRRAQGIDTRQVITARERKSISQERTFSKDLVELIDLKRQLWRMSQRVASYLQKKSTAAGTIAIKIRYSDFTTLTRQMSLEVPTSDAREIYRVALVLLERNWQIGRPVRLLGVGAQQLGKPTGQLALFAEDSD